MVYAPCQLLPAETQLLGILCAAILNTLMHLPFQSRTPGKTVTAFHGNRVFPPSAFTDLQRLNGHHMHLPDSKIISSGPEKVRDRSRWFAGSRVDWREQGFGVRQAQVQPQLQHLAGWPRATCSTFRSCDCICRMVTRVTISQGSCSYVHHSKCSLNAHYFHYHWGILTKAQPPFLSLSLALTYTHSHS